MVDYPIKISATGIHAIGLGVTGTPTIDVSYGPYRRNDDLYCFVIQENSISSSDAHVFKSTDEGLTWAKQDAGNAPALHSNGALFQPYALSCVPYFDLSVIPEIRCLFIDTNADLRVGTFNVVQGQWRALSAAGPSDYEPTVLDDRFAMAARPTGINGIEFPISYQGPKDTVSGTDYERVWYTVYRPATDDWSTPVRLFGVAGEAVHYRVDGAAHQQRGVTAWVLAGRISLLSAEGFSPARCGTDRLRATTRRIPRQGRRSS